MLNIFLSIFAIDTFHQIYEETDPPDNIVHWLVHVQ